MTRWLTRVRDKIRATPVSVVIDSVIPLCAIPMWIVSLLLASSEAHNLFPIRWHVVQHLPMLEVAYQHNAPMWAAVISIMSMGAGMVTGASVLFLICKSRGRLRPPDEGLPEDFETLLKHGLIRLIWDALKDAGLLMHAYCCRSGMGSSSVECVVSGSRDGGYRQGSTQLMLD